MKYQYVEPIARYLKKEYKLKGSVDREFDTLKNFYLSKMKDKNESELEYIKFALEQDIENIKLNYSGSFISLGLAVLSIIVAIVAILPSIRVDLGILNWLFVQLFIFLALIPITGIVDRIRKKRELVYLYFKLKCVYERIKALKHDKGK